MKYSLNQSLKERRYHWGTSFSNKYRQRLINSAYGEGPTISQLTLDRTLDGHTGCVNTLDWSSTGEFLLSGSDDTLLNIYDAYNDFTLCQSIQSGHSANIFSAFFLPSTSDNIIISAAGDSQIRIFDCRKEVPLTNMYVCHKDQVRRLSVFKNNPNEFLSCSQDGTVRHFDLREPHLCSNHRTLCFMTALPVSIRQTILPHGPNVSNGCPEPLVDYRLQELHLNTISINQLNQNYFAVAGQDEYIYLQDMRMPSNIEYVKKFTSTSDIFKRKDKNVTSVKFSDYNGYELLGSWSSDGVYLFNINDTPLKPLHTRSTYESLTKPRNTNNQKLLRTPRQHQEESERRRKSRQKEWENLVEIFKNRPFLEIIRASKQLLHHAVKDHIQLTQSSADKVPFRDTLINECGMFQIAALIVSALARIRNLMAGSNEIRNNTSRIQFTFRTLEDFSDHDFLLAKEELAQARRLVPLTWRGDFGLALGYYYAGCLLLSFNYCTHRNLFVHQALTRHYRAFSAIKESVIKSTMVYRDEYLKRLKELKSRVVTLSRVASTANSLTPPLEIKWDYLSHIVTDTDIDISVQHNEKRRSREKILVLKILGQQSEIGFPSDDEDDEEDELVNFNEFGILDDEDIMDTSPSEYCIYELNSHELDFDHTSSADLEHDTDIISHKMKYIGHRNIERIFPTTFTIKDVDFFGQSDEYVLSGSDDGLLFIWDKKTGEIVQILQADDEVVNVSKGHPNMPIIAVSGIDSTIKIISPKADPFSTSKHKDPDLPSSYSPSSRMYDINQIVSKNQKLRGLEGQNDIEYLSNIKKVSHIVTALGIKLEESSLRDYQDIE